MHLSNRNPLFYWLYALPNAGAALSLVFITPRSAVRSRSPATKYINDLRRPARLAACVVSNFVHPLSQTSRLPQPLACFSQWLENKVRSIRFKFIIPPISFRSGSQRGRKSNLRGIRLL